MINKSSVFSGAGVWDFMLFSSNLQSLGQNNNKTCINKRSVVSAADITVFRLYRFPQLTVMVYVITNLHNLRTVPST